MSYTKKELIDLAFSEIGIATYNFDLQPEQYQEALKRLDSMLATWNSEGIRIGYNLASSPSTSSLNDDSNVRDSAIQAIYTNLALRLAPTFGKVVNPVLLKIANSTYKRLLSLTSEICERDFTTLPKGQGNKPWRYTNDTFIRKEQDTILAGNDSQIDFS